MTKAFISYSWDDDAHKRWVRDLASRLRSDGADVTLDQWHLVPGDQLPAFMETAVRESDFVLIVCTARYKQRSDARSGGVGYEGDIISGQVLTKSNQRKFIPILREAPWEVSAPTWVAGKYCIALTGDPYSEQQYDDLLTTLLGTRPQPPAVGPVRHPGQEASASTVLRNSPSAVSGRTAPEFEEIRITGVTADQASVPRGDGTAGSALYDIPFRLSRRPPREWVDLFLATWDRPPRFSNMHRPGIASIVGDTVHLRGTTLEEVEWYHCETLILAAQEANRSHTELLQRQARKEEVERARIEQHKRNVEDKARGIRFD
jgi:hypothetical protein